MICEATTRVIRKASKDGFGLNNVLTLMEFFLLGF